MPPLNYSVVGIRPDGTIAACQDCDSLDKARSIARLMRLQHSDWTVRIDGRPGETETDMPLVDPDPPIG
jgi:hypothetical protein